MHAAIIGIQGGMGRWFTKHLTGLGYTITGFDERGGDNPSTLAEADLVIVAVPIPATAGIIKKTGKHMKPGACLVEIASLKSGTYEALTYAAEQGVDVLCVHPMFGPSTESLEGKTVAVIPVIDSEKEKSETVRLFPGASFEVVEADEHDRLMSIILSLPYLVNLAFASTIENEDLNRLHRLAGTTFALQYTLTQSIVAEKSDLIKAVLGNNFLGETLDRFTENINEWKTDHKFTERHTQLQDALKRDPSFITSHEKRQRAYNAVRLVK